MSRPVKPGERVLSREEFEVAFWDHVAKKFAPTPPPTSPSKEPESNGK